MKTELRHRRAETRKAQEFNAAVPIGTPVFAWQGACDDDSRRLDTKTRTDAWVLNGHTAVVMVEGQSGCIALSHIQVKE